MLTVRTKTQTSPIADIGLFANEFIPKGTIVWKFKPGFDLLMSDEEVKELTVDYRTFYADIKDHPEVTRSSSVL